MARQELWLFLHISSAIVWMGAGVLMLVLGMRAERAGDDRRLAILIEDVTALANRLFVPASLAVFVFGMAMMLDDGPWEFSSLWIVLGLIGFAITFANGVAVFGPLSVKISRIIKRDNGFSAEASLESRRFITLAWIDYTVLFLVVFDMVVKPTGDDWDVLLGMALLLIAGVWLSLSRARSLAHDPNTV